MRKYEQNGKSRVRAALLLSCEVVTGMPDNACMTFVPDREELAWAAGFFDGEGCFSYSPAARYVCVSIGQTDPEVLHRFKLAVGGLGKINGPYDPRQPGRISKKPKWVYQVYGVERVQAIAAILWFKLGTVKRAQAYLALSRALVCSKGHPKKAGHKGCAACTSDFWRARRDGTLFEPTVPYLSTFAIDVSANHR